MAFKLTSQLGFELKKKTVVFVIKGSQADRLKVRPGMVVATLCGRPAPNDFKKIRNIIIEHKRAAKARKEAGVKNVDDRIHMSFEVFFIPRFYNHVELRVKHHI